MAFAPPARAEATSRPGSERHPAFYLQGGFSTASPHVGGATLGASLLVELGRRLAVEGAGVYLDRGAGASAASLSTGLVPDLVSRNETAVSYLVAGVGLLRSSFDTRNARFSGPAPSGEMGTGPYRHVIEGEPPGWDLGELPPFYGDRVETLIARQGRTGTLSFNDPALSVDARAQLLVRSGEVHAVWVFTIHLGRGL